MTAASAQTQRPARPFAHTLSVLVVLTPLAEATGAIDSIGGLSDDVLRTWLFGSPKPLDCTARKDGHTECRRNDQVGLAARMGLVWPLPPPPPPGSPPPPPAPPPKVFTGRGHALCPAVCADKIADGNCDKACMSSACGVDGGDCTGYVCGAADTGLDDCVKADWWSVHPMEKTPEMEEMERHHMHGPAQAAIALGLMLIGATAACHFQRAGFRPLWSGDDGTRGRPPGRRFRRTKRRCDGDDEAELEGLGDEAAARENDSITGTAPRLGGQVVVEV